METKARVFINHKAEAKANPAEKAYMLKLIRIGWTVTFVTLPVVIYFMPTEPSVQLATPLDRIVFTLRWETMSATTFFVAMVLVANGRAASAAINPLSGNDQLLDFNIRFLQNTFEQFIIGFVGRIILSTYLETTVQRVIPVLVVYFIVSRVIFYYGYKQSSQQRALGMSMTFMSHLIVYAAILYYFIKYGPLYGLQ